MALPAWLVSSGAQTGLHDVARVLGRLREQGNTELNLGISGIWIVQARMLLGVDPWEKKNSIPYEHVLVDMLVILIDVVTLPPVDAVERISVTR